MDLATHALMGSAIVPDSLAQAHPIVLTAAAMMGGMAPDLDALTIALGAERYLAGHRGPMHSVGAAAFTAAVIAGAIHVASGAPFWLLFSFAVLGHLTHVALDLPLSWPIPALWPFTARRFSLNFLGFGDRFVMVVVVGLLIGGLVTHGLTATAFKVAGIGCFASYLAIRFAFYRRAMVVVRAALPPELSGARVFISSPPVQLIPRRWKAYVVKEGPVPSYHVYTVDASRRIVLDLSVLASDPPRNLVAASFGARSVGLLSRRYPHLVAVVEPSDSGTLIRWKDVGTVLRHLVSVEAHVSFDPQGIQTGDRLVVRPRRRQA